MVFESRVMRTSFIAALFCSLAVSVAQAAVFEIIALPDTENYVNVPNAQAPDPGFPGIMEAQTQWVVDNRVKENIVFVTQLGDLIHHNAAAEMPEARRMMDKLDRQVPYSVCSGNHDTENATATNLTTQYFGPTRYSAYDWYKGSFTNKLNHYQIFSAGGYRFLHINLQKDPQNVSNLLAWAQGVIDANRGLPTILSTHDYLNDNTTRSSTGTSIWNNLVKNNPQIFLTLNGHKRITLPNNRSIGVARMVSNNSANKNVLQVLSDFEDYTTQADPLLLSGDANTGYLRKLIFDTENRKLTVKTYSPTFTALPSLTDADHQFSYDMAFLPTAPGTTTSPIFVTDAATCPDSGYVQSFDAVPGPTGTALPLGWTALQIPGTGDTFSNANPVQAANVAAATSVSQPLVVADAAPAGTWGSQAANALSEPGRALATNPGNNAAGVLQLKVSNGLGLPAESVHLSYDLSLPWSNPNDAGTELPGHAIFWSRTGGTTAAEWTPLGQDTTAGAKAWDIALPTALAPGADLYLRWVDDNVLGAGGESAAENVWAIDNVRVTMSAAADAIRTWTGGADGDDHWKTDANWGNAALAAGKRLRFAAPADGTHVGNDNDFDPGTQFNGITFAPDAPAYTLRGNAIRLAGPVVNQSDGDQTIELAAVELMSGGGLFDTGSRDIVVASPISGADMGLTKAGNGTLTLSGHNTYSGGTVVLAGTLVIANADALPSGGSLTIGPCATVVYSSGLNVSRSAVSIPAATHAPQAVPEPSALALLGVAVAAAGWMVAATRRWHSRSGGGCTATQPAFSYVRKAARTAGSQHSPLRPVCAPPPARDGARRALTAPRPPGR
jgi:autotransporter-associated beta strand protein